MRAKDLQGFGPVGTNGPADLPVEVQEKLRWCAERHITREYRTVMFGEHEARQLLAHIESAERELAALTERAAGLEKDAERYRWLRDKANELEGSGPLAFSTGRDGKPTGEGWQAILCGEQLDAAIDAAIAQGDQA